MKHFTIFSLLLALINLKLLALSSQLLASKKGGKNGKGKNHRIELLYEHKKLDELNKLN